MFDLLLRFLIQQTFATFAGIFGLQAVAERL